MRVGNGGSYAGFHGDDSNGDGVGGEDGADRDGVGDGFPSTPAPRGSAPLFSVCGQGGRRTLTEEAADVINTWVAAATNNLISSIIGGPLPIDTDMVIANAVYFKGKWDDEPFTKAMTKVDKFHRLDGTTVDAPFMRIVRGRRQYIGCHDGFKVLRLQYESSYYYYCPPSALFSMCVFLPDARDGLWGLLDRIADSAPAASFLERHLPTRRVEVGDLRLPKFKLSFLEDLTGALGGLGLHSVFKMGEADLSQMMVEEGDEDRPLALDGVVHRAVIEVNEEGTEAAAVTGMLCGVARSRVLQRPVPVDFVADHPFAFFVVEELSGAIVFMGHVLDPPVN